MLLEGTNSSKTEVPPRAGNSLKLQFLQISVTCLRLFQTFTGTHRAGQHMPDSSRHVGHADTWCADS